MSIKDPNVRKLLQRIKGVGKIPEKLMVVKCTGCGDTIFIPAEQGQRAREYWQSIYLGNRCRYHQQTDCHGTYQEIKLTLEKVNEMLKPDKPIKILIVFEPRQLTLPIIIPPNDRRN